MQFIAGNNRHQTYFSTLEEQVTADNSVKLINAFIDKLDLQNQGLQIWYIKAKVLPKHHRYF